VRTFRTYATARTYPLSAPTGALKPQNPQVSRSPIEKTTDDVLTQERLTPQFRELAAAFGAERARLGPDTPDEVDPALVVVFDLAGSVKDFRNAINRVDGLEFLSELLGGATDPDDDFYMDERDVGRTDKPVARSLYLVMSNAKAVDELLRLFNLWLQDQSISFETGLNKFKSAFEQLIAIRRWGPEDRIRETGLRERWQETLEVVGQSASTLLVEAELWYRQSVEKRAEAESRVAQIITGSGGTILDRSQIGAISYHAVTPRRRCRVPWPSPTPATSTAT
jgi:hypothetical protein